MENYYSFNFILKLLRKYLIFVAIFTSLTGFLSALYLYKIPDIFLSSSLVTISGQNNEMSRTSSLLQSFTGTSISSNPDIITNDIVIATAKSRKFILNFIEKYELIPELFLDYEDNNLTKPMKYEIYNIFLNKHLSIIENQANGYLTFNLRHQSPDKAYKILSNFIEELDNYFRDYKKNKAREAISFYENESNNTTNKNLSLSLINLIEQNYQTLSFTNMSDRYALIEIDPPNMPEMKVYPNRTLLTILYTFLSFLISIVFSTIYGIYRNEKTIKS